MTRTTQSEFGILPLFDAGAIEDEWRTVPSDLAGWSMRATAMLILAKRYHRELLDVQTALATVAPLTPHVMGCDEPDDPHCGRCVMDSEIARITEALS